MSFWFAVTESWVVYSNYIFVRFSNCSFSQATYYVSHSFFAIYVFLHHPVLINTYGCQDIEGIFVARVDPIENKADHNLLPSRSTFVPEFGLLDIDDISYILHDTVQSTCREYLVLIVVCDSNEELCMSVVHRWTEVVAILQGEIIRVASGGSIYDHTSAYKQYMYPHIGSTTSEMRELLAPSLQIIPVPRLHSILNSAGHGVINTENRSLNQLDFPGCVSPQVRRSGSLSLLPCFC